MMMNREESHIIFYIWLYPTSFLNVLSSSKNIYLGAAGLIIIGQCDILILGLFRSDMKELANFQLALQILAIFFIFSQSISAYIYGRLGSNSSYVGLIGFKRLLFIPPIIVGVLAIFSSYTIPHIAIFFGEGFHNVSTYYNVIVYSVPIVAFKYLLEPFAIYYGMAKENSINTLISGSLLVMINLVFTTSYGAIASAWGILISNLFLAILLLSLYKKIAKEAANRRP
jgi:O-antigen/teichoic acid export membrane protein